MKTSMRVVAAAAGLLLVAGSAQAATAFVNVNQLLNAGGTYSGQFNIASYLNGFDVVSAKVVATGFSPSNQTQQLGSTYGLTLDHVTPVLVHPGYTSYVGVGCIFGCYVPPVYGEDRFFETHRDLTILDAPDVMLLDVGDGQGVGLTALNHSEGAYSAIFVNSPFGSNGSGGDDYLTTLQRTVFNTYAGPLSATAVLSANDLAGLNNGGLLNFSLKAAQGNMFIQGAQLQFELRDISTGVPEPATWAMMLVGFGALGSVLRRRRAVAQAT